MGRPRPDPPLHPERGRGGRRADRHRATPRSSAAARATRSTSTRRGIGRIIARPRPQAVRPGDRIILTGTLGEHSLAILAARGEFGFEAASRATAPPLNFLLPFWKRGVLWMRDITRGGLATILSELAERMSPIPS